MTLAFGLNAPARLAALKRAVERFRADSRNKDLAGDCACKTWHLCEHVLEVLKAGEANFPFTKMEDWHDYMKGVCPELAHLQVICNAAKHGNTITRTGDIEDTHDRPGDFDPKDFCPVDWDTPRLEIELTNRKKVPLINVLDPAVAFWSQFFDDRGIK